MRLSFPKPGIWIFAWIAFVPLFFAIENKRPFKSFLLSYICGAVFFITTLFWLINVTTIGLIVLSLYLALYVAVFGIGVAFLTCRLNLWQRIIFIPSLWVVLEFIRGILLTGFPWAILGNCQAGFLPAIQAADIVGALGVSFIVVFANILVFELIKSRFFKSRFNLKQFLILALVLVVWFGYGVWRLTQSSGKSCFVKVAVIQGNIAQEIKWATSFQEHIFQKYCLLTEIASLKDSLDLVVWPETSYPQYITPGIDDEQIKKFAGNNGVALLAGSIMLRQMNYYNSAILFSNKGDIVKVYDKIHLVPFGEYIPARKKFPFLERIVPIEDFTFGKDYSVFSVPCRNNGNLHFSVLICFEDIFGYLARRFVARGADVLINVTNDAWFGDTSSPYQHMQSSVLRAVENRVVVVRSANTGISCFIDDTGKVYSLLKDKTGKPTFVTGYQSAWVYRTQRGSIYTKIGDVFALACIFYCFIIFIWGMKNRG